MADDKIPYSDALDGDEQVRAEEEIAAYISDERFISVVLDGDEIFLTEEEVAQIGRDILYMVLRRFRPDLFV